MKKTITNMFIKKEDAVKAYINAVSYNDCHPCGGTNESWEWERSLRIFLSKYD